MFSITGCACFVESRNCRFICAFRDSAGGYSKPCWRFHVQAVHIEDLTTASKMRDKMLHGNWFSPCCDRRTGELVTFCAFCRELTIGSTESGSVMALSVAFREWYGFVVSSVPARFAELAEMRLTLMG